MTNGTLINAGGANISVSAGGGEREIFAQIDNRGTITLNYGLNVSKGLAAHTNSGTIAINAGTLRISGTGASLTNTSTGIIQGSGILDVSGTSLTNNGIINPGTSPGVLTITGNLPHASSSIANIELGGTTVGTEYDRLAVSGATTLGGTLNVALVDPLTRLSAMLSPS